jgi:predicted nuclease of predicted toxin-antitoxin system
MKIKLDENLPSSLAASLSALQHDVDTVPGEGLRGRADPDIWQAAQTAGRFLITQDLDFSDVRRYVPGTHYGVLLIRLRIPGRRALFRRVRDLFMAEEVESWRGCFLVATDVKLRVRRPPAGSMGAPAETR